MANRRKRVRGQKEWSPRVSQNEKGIRMSVRTEKGISVLIMTWAEVKALTVQRGKHLAYHRNPNA